MECGLDDGDGLSKEEEAVVTEEDVVVPLVVSAKEYLSCVSTYVES